jgi:hypothetical protein
MASRNLAARDPNAPASPKRIAFAMTVIFAPALIYFVESLVWLFLPLKLPEEIAAVVYPPYKTLSTYCAANRCLFDPASVSSLYALQFATLVGLSTVQAILVLRSKRQVKRMGRKADRAVLISVSVITLVVVLDYVTGNFSFDSYTIHPNTVTDSPAGLFYYIFRFWVFGIAVVLFSTFLKTREGAGDAS